MYKKALLLYNGHAGQGDITETLTDIVGLIAGDIRELTLLQTEEKGEPETFCRQRGGEFDLLIIVGGDGTVHECINGLMKLKNSPVISIIPTGTCNDFSRSLMIPQTIKEAAELIKTGSVENIDIGQFNDRYFSNFFGVGLITEASEGTDAHLKNSIGKFSYIISALQSLKNPTSFSFSLNTDNDHFRGEAVMILAMNGYYLGTTNLHLDETKMDDGLFEIYLIQKSGLKPLKNMYNKAFSTDWTKETEGIELIRSSSFTLETNQTLDVDMDGEIYSQTPANVSIANKRLPFITARGFN